MFKVNFMVAALAFATQAAPMRTEVNSPVVREVALEAEFVVWGGGRAHVFAFDANGRSDG